MKKFLALVLAVLMACTLFGCGKKETAGTDEPKAAEEDYDVVFLADLGSIYDGGFNEFSYKGIDDYVKEKGMKATYLQPGQDSDDARVAIFEQAVNQLHAEVLVAVGYLWDAALTQCVPQYPDVKVVFIDADVLTDDSGNYFNNLALINFAEQDCGFLAGYAIVKEGYRNLAFFGGMGVPAVIRFGLGWVMGAELAATELGLGPDSINMTYWYSGSFDETPEKTTKVSSWYEAGTEVVFSCGGSIVGSAVAAAEAADGRYLVGVDIDQADLSERVLTSAMKSLENTVYSAVDAAYKGGADWDKYSKGLFTASAVDGGTTLPTHFERFNNFTEADYETALKNLADTYHASLPTDADVVDGDPTSLPLTCVKLTYEK